MAVSGAKKITGTALRGWSGGTAQPHGFGGTEYRLGRREISHVHGDHLVDIPLPKKVRNELVAAGLKMSSRALRYLPAAWRKQWGAVETQDEARGDARGGSLRMVRCFCVAPSACGEGVPEMFQKSM